MIKTYVPDNFKFNTAHWTIGAINQMLLNAGLFLEEFENVEVEIISIRKEFSGWTIEANNNFLPVSTQFRHLNGQIYFKTPEALIEYLEGVKTVLVAVKKYQWK